MTDLPNYIIFENRIFKDKEINWTTKGLYCLINALSNNKNKACYANNLYLSTQMNVTERNIQIMLQQLKINHYIEIKTYKNKRYIIPIINKFLLAQEKSAKAAEDKINELDEEYDWLNE